MFNEVLLHMELDDDKASVISRLADDYERGEGECFNSKLPINDRTKKSPLLWWGAYGGLAYELQHLAKHIVSLCASASGCERNWSCFQNIHSKKRNRLEFQRLNDLSYVQYNQKNADRSRGSGSQAVVTHVYSRSRVHQVGEDEDEEDDANQEVELEDYSTSEDDQEGNQGEEGEGGGEERGSIGFDDDLDY
ncbi:uncharacterized protein LOC119272058 [Triticum dicoccoides]|uniref:uncharacterized protein LOC119272058 n=1 Tax=Triticum dicoccoides TaxID=85692 RepID=UPI00188F14A6|nr:uncharacterized protein LOC119272058 [Triticum dicoccoides]